LADTSLPAKSDAEYWRARLFKNTFTYKGRRRKVNAWSVKIQWLGKRKTFSLRSGNVLEASVEACRIYQTVSTQGWDAVSQRRGQAGPPSGFAPPNPELERGATPGLEDWKGRLLNRPYPALAARSEHELSARIEHAGLGCYFPLGTNDEFKAAALARQIHLTVAHQGWPAAQQQFRRELTLAFHWLDDPVAWTYTTLHTWRRGDEIPILTDPPSRSLVRTVAIIEPDTGIRLALVACINRQEGFHCCAAHANLAGASREITRHKIDLILANSILPDPPSANGQDDPRQIRSAPVSLPYSVYEDSDQLFLATPGGAAGYLLKRTPMDRIMEPIAEAARPLTREVVAVKVRDYFQRLVTAMPSGPSALEIARLTAREQEILALLARGRLAKEIAHSLGISIWTVNGHVKSIFEKLKVHTRTEAVVKFLQK